MEIKSSSVDSIKKYILNKFGQDEVIVQRAEKKLAYLPFIKSSVV